MKVATQLLMLFCLNCIAISCKAHEITGNGFMTGLYHPVFGLDHLLAMLSVGILSTQIGGRAIWIVPATFVAVMLVAGWTGMQAVLNLASSQVERGIIFSVVLLGLVIALERRMPVLIVILLVAFFAVFHGYAHGVEMPAKANPYYFAVGFVISTLLIHITGVLIGLIAGHWRSSATLLRYAGSLMMGMGIQMLLG